MEKSPHIVPRVLSFFSPQPPYIKKEASAEERAASRKAEYFNGDTAREHNVPLFSLETLNKSLRTSQETNFRLISNVYSCFG